MFLFCSAGIFAQTHEEQDINTIKERINKQILINDSLNTKIHQINQEIAEIERSLTLQNDEIDSLNKIKDEKLKEIRSYDDRIASPRERLNAVTLALNETREEYKFIRKLRHLNERKEELSNEIDQLNIDLNKIQIELEALADIENQYTNSKRKKNNLSRTIEEIKYDIEIHNDSLTIIRAIIRNRSKIKNENNANIKNIENLYCGRIENLISEQDYYNEMILDELSYIIDSIYFLDSLGISTIRLKACKTSAKQYQTFALWYLNAIKILNSDYSPQEISQAKEQAENMSALSPSQHQLRDKIVELISNYCKKYESILERVEFINSLNLSRRIIPEINRVIEGGEFQEYPYILKEMQKKIDDTTYIPQFDFNPEKLECN